MRILTVVEWKYNAVWELSAIFVEPKEAEKYAHDLEEEFPADDIRIVKRKVSVDDDIAGYHVS